MTNAKELTDFRKLSGFHAPDFLRHFLAKWKVTAAADDGLRFLTGDRLDEPSREAILAAIVLRFSLLPTKKQWEFLRDGLAELNTILAGEGKAATPGNGDGSCGINTGHETEPSPARAKRKQG